ncbi:hypothetical protein D9757_009786 [Collybiopsis confluens]|uniref:DUF6532 domain-containing protein n=1 Tax=Collybiopsis confluens TaxID=2823264 RepID=A0A8H5HF18_9AGAR|nr:hypothetical protein D9757_009786 [Collybiopsis confluens]
MSESSGSRMSVRLGGRKLVAPQSLIPKTREEQRSTKAATEALKEENRDAVEQKKKSAKNRVAAQLDKQANEDSNTHFRPDLATENLPADGSEDNAEDDSEDEQKLKNLEDEIYKMQKQQERIEKKKASKTALRQDITALRVIPPKGPTGSTKNNKRAGTQHDTRPVDPKRQKHTDLGGLQPTWKSILNATKARSTSTTSSTIASQSDIQFDEVENGGELGKDESVEQLKVQRDGKSHDTSPKVFVAVKLESVDADGIAQEERETGKPARPPKPRVKRADIPFVSASDHDVWKSKIQPGIIVWAGTRAKQFQVNADPEFRTITRQLWNTHLGTLAHMPLNYTDMNGRSSLRCDHPAILAYAQQQIRNYRSKFASAALSIVVSHMEQYSDSTEDRKQLVDELLHHDAFIYENVGPTRCESTGAFRGKLIMQTFAFHLTWALSAPPSTMEKEEHPGGALALAVTAVKRALKLCTPGYNTLSQKSSGRNTPRNNPDSFDEKCAADLSLFYQTIMDLKDSKWELIYAASEKHILHCPHLGAGPALKDARKNLNMQGVGAVEDVDGASSDGVSLDNLIVLSD